MAKFNITKKTTKEAAAKLLGANLDNVRNTKDKNLTDRVVYTIQHLTDATRKDVIDVLKDVMKAVGTAFVVPAAADEADTSAGATSQDTAAPKAKTETPKAENLVKKTSGAKKSTSADTEDEPAEEEKPKTKAKGGKKKSDNAPVGMNDAENNPKTVTLAKMFPESITVGGKEFKVHHNVTLATLADETLDFEFAFYWTKRHLKQFPYFNDLLGHPKSFPNDLDTAQLIYVDDGDENGENRRVAYAVSDSTGAIYTILPDFLEEMDGLCCGAGIEFQVYSRPAEDETDDTDSEEDEADE